MDYPLYKQVFPNKNYVDTALRGSACPTALAKVFFSADNLNIIQNAIRYRTWESSEKTAIIARQSDDELIVIMRAVYLQHAKHFPTNISGQVEDLNQLVVNQVVPTILSELTGHLLYLKDRFAGLSPLPPPVNVNSAGMKLNRSITSTFNM